MGGRGADVGCGVLWTSKVVGCGLNDGFEGMETNTSRIGMMSHMMALSTRKIFP